MFPSKHPVNKFRRCGKTVFALSDNLWKMEGELKFKANIARPALAELYSVISFQLETRVCPLGLRFFGWVFGTEALKLSKRLPHLFLGGRQQFLECFMGTLLKDWFPHWIWKNSETKYVPEIVKLGYSLGGETTSRTQTSGFPCRSRNVYVRPSSLKACYRKIL